MVFSYEKKHTLKKQKERGAGTFFLALMIATAFFVPFIVYGKGYFIFFGDFNVQQIPFYQMCHEAIRNGELGWNWLTDLGSSFISSYSFYLLGSPFFWLTLPFPNSFVPYLMGPLLILKFSLAAFTAYYYIRRFTRTPFAAQVGALLYAFSGFSVYNIFFNHFHEAIILFPLLLLSMELLITENKRGLFAVTVALCAINNYFFFFGMVVFSIIYWFIRNISGAIKFRFSRFLTLITEAVLGVALSAFILLPSVIFITGNGRVSEFLTGWSGIVYGKEQIYLNIIECFFFPPDLPARPVFFPGANVKWSSLAGWLPLFSMTAVLGFCLKNKKHWLKRVLCVSFFMAMIPILNSAFYAFNSAYYARWFYMPILMMALATAITLEDSDSNWKQGFNWTAVITVGIALVVGLFPQIKDGETVLGLYTDAGESQTYLMRFIWAVGIAVLSLALCRLLIYLKDKSQLLFRRSSIAFLCIITVAYSGVFILQGTTHSYDIDSVMTDSLIEGEVSLPIEENFRIDTFDCVDNTAMYLGYPTINAFHSVVSPSIMEYYDFIGVKRDVASRPEQDYYSIRNLLSVKYLLNRVDSDSFVGEDGKTLMPDYKYITTNGGYYIYENENFIPYGFSYDYYITRSECELMYSGVQRADLMLKAIVLEDDDAPLYSSGMQSFKEYINSLSPDEEDTALNEQTEYIFSSDMDEKTLKNDSKHLAESSAISFERDKKGFSATVDRNKATLVFFSVPYDDGWSVTVNGEKAEIIKANIGFMAVAVPEGISDIRFDYTTPFLKEGIIISLGALIVFIIYLSISIPISKARRKNEVYPEGEELLHRFKEEEVREECEFLREFEKEQTLLDSLSEEREIFIPDNATKYHSFNVDLEAFESKEDIDKNNQE